MKDEEMVEIEEVIKEIGYKKYRVNTEIHLFKGYENRFKQPIKAIITIFNRKTIKHEDLSIIHTKLLELEYYSFVEAGFTEWLTPNQYMRKDCFIIFVVEKED